MVSNYLIDTDSMLIGISFIALWRDSLSVIVKVDILFFLYDLLPFILNWWVSLSLYPPYEKRSERANMDEIELFERKVLNHLNLKLSITD